MVVKENLAAKKPETFQVFENNRYANLPPIFTTPLQYGYTARESSKKK